jgi:D-tyrosyl-tRNA(Tyr) deacylase
VTEACVRVGDRTVGEIALGLVVLVAIGRDDGPADVRYLVGKIRDARLFPGNEGKPMDRSIVDVAGAVLLVSQFTLYGDLRKGRRPSFDAAARPEAARALYEDLVRELRAVPLPVATGEFQEESIVPMMQWMFEETMDGIRRASEDAFLNGDKVSPGIDNDITYTVDSTGGTDCRNRWNGVRWHNTQQAGSGGYFFPSKLLTTLAWINQPGIELVCSGKAAIWCQFAAAVSQVPVVFKSDLALHAKRPMTWILVVIMALTIWGMSTGNVRIDSGDASVGGRDFIVVDTGGFEPEHPTGILREMAKQTRQAVAEADAVIFVTDVRAGVSGQDHDIAKYLRSAGKKVLLAVNKAEGMADSPLLAEFHELGLGDPLPISAAHGQGIIHRDLKPANICATPRGLALVTTARLPRTNVPHHRPNPTAR